MGNCGKESMRKLPRAGSMRGNFRDRIGKENQKEAYRECWQRRVSCIDRGEPMCTSKARKRELFQGQCETIPTYANQWETNLKLGEARPSKGGGPISLRCVCKKGRKMGILRCHLRLFFFQTDLYFRNLFPPKYNIGVERTEGKWHILLEKLNITLAACQHMCVLLFCLRLFLVWKLIF